MHTAHGVHSGVQARLTDGTLEISWLRAGQSLTCAGRLVASLGPHPGMDGLDVAFASTTLFENLYLASVLSPVPSNCTYYLLSRYTCQPSYRYSYNPHDVL